MVRVNLIDPKNLSDQHLIAEYYEIAILVSYIRRYPDLSNIPATFRLGTGHMRFFKDKVLYLSKRYKKITDEMERRKFRVGKSLEVKGFGEPYMNDWLPRNEDVELVKLRLKEKVMEKGDGFYRYYGKPMTRKEMLSIIDPD